MRAHLVLMEQQPPEYYHDFDCCTVLSRFTPTSDRIELDELCIVTCCPMGLKSIVEYECVHVGSVRQSPVSYQSIERFLQGPSLRGRRRLILLFEWYREIPFDSWQWHRPSGCCLTVDKIQTPHRKDV